MLKDEKRLIFEKDPYREDKFELKVEPGNIVNKVNKKEINLQENKIEEKERTVKEVLTDAFRQIVASIIILAIGFLLLNWSAYYQIIKNKWNEYSGTQTVEQMSLEKIAGNFNPAVKKINQQTNSQLTALAKEIPALNLEVTPYDDRLIIPRISQNIPIVKVSSKNLLAKDWNALEKDMQKALQNGVIHYPGTSIPSQHGNTVITGHSSYFPWDPGKFKDVFALLHQLSIGDKIVIYYDQEKYIYEVIEKKVVMPTNIDILKQTPEDQLTLITCTPVGTNLKRLVVIAKPVKNSD